MNLNDIKSVYFVGIGGIGMSAIARYFLHKGLTVGGYDKTPSDLTKKLPEEGAFLGRYFQPVDADGAIKAAIAFHEVIVSCQVGWGDIGDRIAHKEEINARDIAHIVAYAVRYGYGVAFVNVDDTFLCLVHTEFVVCINLGADIAVACFLPVRIVDEAVDVFGLGVGETVAFHFEA